MKKNLTDDEIVKAYFVDCKKRSCETCPLGDIENCHDRIQDLIHRLQNEKKELTEERENMQAVIFGLEEDKRQLLETIECRDRDNDQVTKDCQRLQSELEYKTECYDELCDMNNGMAEEISEQKAEIERLTEENGYLKQCADNFLADYQKAQKQVDELTEKLGKVLLGVKADEVLIAKGVEQSVKDTAKDILKFAKPFIDIEEFINACAEVWGVEVE